MCNAAITEKRTRNNPTYAGQDVDDNEARRQRDNVHVSFFECKYNAKDDAYEWPGLEVAEEPEAGDEEGLRLTVAAKKGAAIPIMGYPALDDCGTTHSWKYTTFGRVWPTGIICGHPHHETYKKVPVWGLAAWAKVNESMAPNCFMYANCIWLMDDLPAGTFLSVNYGITEEQRGKRGYEIAADDEEAFQRRDDKLKAYLDKHKEKLFQKPMRDGYIEKQLNWLANKISALKLKETMKSVVHKYDLPKGMPLDLSTFKLHMPHMSTSSVVTCMYSEFCLRSERSSSEPHYVEVATKLVLCWGCHAKLLEEKHRLAGQKNPPAIPPLEDCNDEEMDAARTLAGAKNEVPATGAKNASCVKHVSFTDSAKLNDGGALEDPNKRDLLNGDEALAKKLQDAENAKAMQHAAQKKHTKYIPGEVVMECGQVCVYTDITFKNDCRSCKRGDVTQYGDVEAVVSISRTEKGQPRTDYVAIVSLQHRKGEKMVMCLEWLKDRMVDAPSKYATDELCKSATLAWCKDNTAYLQTRKVIARPKWFPEEGVPFDPALIGRNRLAAASSKPQPVKAASAGVNVAEEKGETLLEAMMCAETASMWAFTVDCVNLDKKLPTDDAEGAQEDYESRMHKCCSVGDGFALLSPAIIPAAYRKRYLPSHIYIVGVIDSVYKNEKAGVPDNRKWVHTWNETVFWLAGKDAVPLGVGLGGMVNSTWVPVDKRPSPSNPWSKAIPKIIAQIHDSYVLPTAGETAKPSKRQRSKARTPAKTASAKRSRDDDNASTDSEKTANDTDDFEKPTKRKLSKKKKQQVLSDSEDSATDRTRPRAAPRNTEAEDLKRELAEMKAKAATRDAVDLAKRELEVQLKNEFTERANALQKKAEDADAARLKMQQDNLDRARDEAAKASNLSGTLMLSAIGMRGYSCHLHYARLLCSCRL